MKAHQFITAIILLASCSLVPIETGAQTNTAAAATSSGYAPVNGQKIYYEVHGTGRPIILLHGAYMTINLNWSQIIPELSKTRRVIALELQGHGRTADIGRAFSYRALAGDVAGVMKHLKIDSADVMGYSFGGTVAMQLAIQHPEMVRQLVIVSTTYRYDGWLPEVREMLKSFNPEFLDSTPLFTEYKKIAPEPEHWREFVAKMIAFDKEDFNLGEENIRKIKSPTLLIMGDNDGVDLNHVAAMYKLLGGDVFGDLAGLPKSQLAVLPGKTHVSLMMDAAQILELLNGFLSKEK